MIDLGIIQTLMLFLAALVAGWVGLKQAKINKQQAKISADLLTMQFKATELTAVSALLGSIHSQLQWGTLAPQQKQDLQGAVGHYHNQLHGVLKSIGR